MSYRSTSSARIFRLFFLLLGGVFFAVSIYNFHRHISTPTDENLFASSPTRLYIVKSIPSDGRFHGKSKQEFSASRDSIRSGDFLMQINGRNISDIDIANRYLDSVPLDSTVEMGVFRPSMQKYLRYRIVRRAIPDQFLRYIPASVYVLAVIKDGASDRSGMRVGDVITRINETEFYTAHEADRILRSNASGSTISYDILRSGNPLTLRVRLARFGVQSNIFVLVLCGWLWMLFGLFLGIRRPCEPAARILGAAFLLMGLFISLTLVQRIYEIPLFIQVRYILMSSALFLSLPFFMHSKFYFPKTHTLMLGKTGLPWIYYAVSAVGLAFYYFYHRFYFFYITLFVLLFIHTLVGLRFRKTSSAESKRMMRPFWIAIGIGLVAAFALHFWLVRHHLMHQIGYLGIPLLVIPIAFLYTIGRYRIMDIDLRVRRNIQYTLISVLWSAGIVFLLLRLLFSLPAAELNLPDVRISGPFIEIADAPNDPDKREVAEKGFLMFFAVALTFAFWKIGSWGQHWLDHKYFRSKYNYRQAASELAEVISTPQTISELASKLVNKLADIMHLERIGVIFLRNESECCCHESVGYTGTLFVDLCTLHGGRFLQRVRDSITEARFSIDNLPKEFADQLRTEQFHHLLPIRSKGKFLGILFTGAKLSETPLNQEDFDFLKTAVKQTAVASENAFLYEELSENQRITHELEIARHIQMTSIPQTAPQFPGLDISGISIPAQEVGGDFYDFLIHDLHAIDIVIGDVSGKGISAALYMSKVQGILRSLHEFDLSPKDLFIRANAILSHDLEKKYFITTLDAHVNTQTRQFSLARAGHLPLFFYRHDSLQVEVLTPRGIGLGLDNDGKFASSLQEYHVSYQPGDVMLFVTDGVTEVLNPSGDDFGEDRLIELFRAIAHLSAVEIRDRIVRETRQFSGDALQLDDQTLVVVKAF
ncbi:SpoIIE family protein phosphatase [candidate division KSB1 bacterium]|nr:SpoIIE family protein phosphatase [candidate division KSB1 bacterium]